MRILFILPGLSIGGTEKMVAHLAHGLNVKGHQVKVIGLKGPGPAGEAIKACGIAVETLNTPSGLFHGLGDIPRLFTRLHTAIREYKPNVVQSFLTRANVL